MRLWEDTVLRVEPSLARGKPPELANFPKRVSVDELLQTRLMMTVKRAWRNARPAAAQARRIFAGLGRSGHHRGP